MSLDAWITAAVVALMLTSLALDLMPPAATVLTATVALLVSGVIDEAQAFSGFSNSAPLSVAALYVLAYAADKTGLLGPLVNRMLGKEGRITQTSQARLNAPTAVLSAFINNTPLVAMLIGQITTWCNQRGVSPSKLLLPVSYAAILGGTLTVIGTSTNLVASGLLQETGEPPIGIFEITKVSGISVLCAMTVLVFIVPRLLPARRAAIEEFAEELREFTLQMEVVKGGPLDGSTIAEAGLRNLKGVFLVEIERDGAVLPAVSPSRRLSGGDRLTFAGDSDSVVGFQRTPGLRSAESQHMLEIDSPQHTFFEAVIGADSRLAGRTLAEIGFRGVYQAAVVAVHRAGVRIEGGLGRVELEPGDTLLLLAGPDFRAHSRRSRDFLLVTRLGGPPPSATRRAPFVGILALAVIGLAAFEVMSILEAALLAAGALLATKTLSFSEAGEAIDFSVILLIAAAFGIGEAMQIDGPGRDPRQRPARRLQRLGGFRDHPRPRTRNDHADRGDHQQRRRCRRLPDRHGGGCLGRSRSADHGDDDRGSRLILVPDPDGLPDQHHGLRPRRIQVLRLRSRRPAAQHHRLARGHADRVAAVLTGPGWPRRTRLATTQLRFEL